jgi:hypothetical protein
MRFIVLVWRRARANPSCCLRHAAMTASVVADGTPIVTSDGDSRTAGGASCCCRLCCSTCVVWSDDVARVSFSYCSWCSRLAMVPQVCFTACFCVVRCAVSVAAAAPGSAAGVGDGGAASGTTSAMLCTYSMSIRHVDGERQSRTPGCGRHCVSPSRALRVFHVSCVTH